MVSIMIGTGVVCTMSDMSAWEKHVEFTRLPREIRYFLWLLG